VGTTVKIGFRFYSVADYFAAAVMAFRRQCVDGTFEAIEKMNFFVQPYLHAFVIVVTASFAFMHNNLLVFSQLGSKLLAKKSSEFGVRS
jgi:hypothetical protein